MYTLRDINFMYVEGRSVAESPRKGKKKTGDRTAMALGETGNK